MRTAVVLVGVGLAVVLPGCGGGENDSSPQSKAAPDRHAAQPLPLPSENSEFAEDAAAGVLEARGPAAAIRDALEAGRIQEDQDPRTYPPGLQRFVD